MRTESEPGRRTHRHDLFLLFGFIIVLGTIAVLLGADGNGDLRNYHYYSGWALLHKPVGFDIAPAQLQTYHHPLLDSLYYVISTALNHHPLVFTFVWSIPQAVAVWLGYLIARQCLPTPMLALAAAAIGAFGATSIGVIGTSMSEGIPNSLSLWSILLILRGDARSRDGSGAARLYATAGLLAGAAAVLKLSNAPYLVAFAAAIPAVMLLEPRVPRVRSMLAFGMGVIVALVVIGGPWWLAVYRAFGNPLFPYYNAIFHSPYYLDQNLFDDRFLPRTPWEWLLYPVEWAFHPSTLVSEQPVRDGRVLAEVIAALALIAVAVARRWRGALSPSQIATTFCAVYVLAAYAVWLKMFSILRYASGLETISGVVIVALLCSMVRDGAARIGLALAVLVLLTATLVVPIWERRPHPGKLLIGTNMPTLPSDSTVLLFGPVEKAFLAPFEPASVRFVGVANNIVVLSRRIGLDDLISRAVADAPGPLWDLTDDATRATIEARWLDRLGLHRTGECRRVTATIAPPMTLCRLVRTP